MADPINDETTPSADGPASPPLPVWVKIFGAVALVVLVVFVIVLLTGGPGAHGPGRHTGSGEVGIAAALGGQAPPASERLRR